MTCRGDCSVPGRRGYDCLSMRKIPLVCIVIVTACCFGSAVRRDHHRRDVQHRTLPPALRPAAKDDRRQGLAGRAGDVGDKDQLDGSEVILDPKFNPDMLVIEECCEQDELEKFNKTVAEERVRDRDRFPEQHRAPSEAGHAAQARLQGRSSGRTSITWRKIRRRQRARRQAVRARACICARCRRRRDTNSGSASRIRRARAATASTSPSGGSREAKRTHEIMKELGQRPGPTT